MLLITWPLIIFIIINFFDLENVNLIFMTIPKLYNNRMADESSFSFLNVVSTIKLLIFQNDGLYWNVIPMIGIAYIYSFPIFIIGIITCIKNLINKCENESKNIIDTIFLLWLIAGFVLCLFLSEININRANIIIIPFIFFVIKGFIFLYKYKVCKIVSIILVLISFAVFSYRYIDLNIKRENNIIIEAYNHNKDDTFAVGLEPVIKYVDKIEARDIYLLGTGRLPDIYVLYYLKMLPSEYKNIVYFKGTKDVHSFGKWHFEKPVEMKDFYGKSYINMANAEGIVYVLPESYESMIDKNIYDITKIGYYIVCEYRP